MMNMNEMRKSVMEELKKMVQEDIEVRPTDVIKQNDQHLCGLAFTRGDVGATVYINDYADDYFTGRRSAHSIAEELMVQVENPVGVPPWNAIEEMRKEMSLAAVKDHLIVTLLEIKRNKEFLKTVPYREIGYGLAFICRIKYEDHGGNGFSCTTVTEDMLQSNGWNTAEMFDQAIENTMLIDGPKLTTMEDTLWGDAEDLLQTEQPIPKAAPLVLTNQSGVFGASSLWLPGIIDQVLTRIGEPVYAIPSSIHEYLLIPQSSGIALDTLSAMCREANQTVVQVSEVLSDVVIFLNDKPQN